MIRLLLTWIGLMLLLGVEIVGAGSHAGWLGWLMAPIMVLLVASIFMEVTRASGLSRIFAITGLFWAAILLGLGSVDFRFRRVIPAPALTAPYRQLGPGAPTGAEPAP